MVPSLTQRLAFGKYGLRAAVAGLSVEVKDNKIAAKLHAADKEMQPLREKSR